MYIKIQFFVLPTAVKISLTEKEEAKSPYLKHEKTKIESPVYLIKW